MKANKEILVQFSQLANKALDAVKKGEKVDRKQVVAGIQKKLGADTMTEMDGLNVLAVLIKNRGDFNSVKGPQGGTFKL